MTNKKTYTRIALTISVVFMMIWGLMGTGTSLAWFTDTDKEDKNIFHYADFEVEAEYRDASGNWKSIAGDTKIFDDEALY